MSMIRFILVVLFVLGSSLSVEAKDYTIFELKNVDAKNVDPGQIYTAIGQDGGPMIKVTPIQKMIDEAKKKKVKKMSLVVGVKGGKLFVRIKSKKYSAKKTIMKDYQKKKDAKAMVINMDKGDEVIDDSSKRMAKAKGTKVTDEGKAKGKNVQGDIILLAHGEPTGKAPGKVYAKKFANKSPKGVVKYLTKDMKLSKKYSGTIYLDGCYTAAGPSSKKGKPNMKELNNFAGKVYRLLSKKGYEYVTVKGNLGAAITGKGGEEWVEDAQVEKQREVNEKRMAKLAKKIKKYSNTHDKLEGKIKNASVSEEALAKEVKGATGKKKAKLGKKLKKVKAQHVKLKKRDVANRQRWTAAYNEWKKLEADSKKTGVKEEYIQDLVGTFGPMKLPD